MHTSGWPWGHFYWRCTFATRTLDALLSVLDQQRMRPKLHLFMLRLMLHQSSEYCCRMKIRLALLANRACRPKCFRWRKNEQNTHFYTFLLGFSKASSPFRRSTPKYFTLQSSISSQNQNGNSFLYRHAFMVFYQAANFTSCLKTWTVMPCFDRNIYFQTTIRYIA